MTETTIYRALNRITSQVYEAKEQKYIYYNPGTEGKLSVN